MIEVLKNPKADPQAKKGIEEELIRLAKIADSIKSWIITESQNFYPTDFYEFGIMRLRGRIYSRRLTASGNIMLAQATSRI